MKKLYLLIPTGYYWLQVVELRSKKEIEFSIDLLEDIAPLMIDNNIGSYEPITESDDLEKSDSYIYLDLSFSKKDNCYILSDNLKIESEIPESYSIDLIINIDKMEATK